MPEAASVAWGTSRIALNLAHGRYRFTGLSERQAGPLAERYRPYQVPGRMPGATLDCTVFRLARPLGLDPASFKWNGQYAMALRRTADALDITGINFRARVLWRGGPVARLGVHGEAELAGPSVIENFMRVVSAHQALRAGGLLLHSAGLVIDGRAHIFAGYSGVGKTTLTRKAHADGVPVLSDDMNLVLPGDDGVFRAYPVPFAGEFGLSLDAMDPAGYPLGGMHALTQGGCLARNPLSLSASVARLTAACPFVNGDESSVPPLLEAATGLATRVLTDELVVGRDTAFEAVRTLLGESVDA